MLPPWVSRRMVFQLTVWAVMLPMIVCVVIGVAALLEGMGDYDGGVMLRRIALFGGILWTIDLIGLLMVLAIGSLRGPDEPES